MEINGTAIIVYADSELIAYQQGLSLAVSQNLNDATNKESGGWVNVIPTILSSQLSFDGLFASPTLKKSGKELMDYILDRKQVLVEIIGLGYPIVGLADLKSLKFDAPAEGVMKLSGEFAVNGKLYVLSDGNLLTALNSGNTYNTLTMSGLAISKAKATAASLVRTNTFSVTNAEVYTFITYLKLTSGQFPFIALKDGNTDISNKEQLKAGINIVKLTASATKTARLEFSNSLASEFKTGIIYLT